MNALTTPAIIQSMRVLNRVGACPGLPVDDMLVRGSFERARGGWMTKPGPPCAFFFNRVKDAA